MRVIVATDGSKQSLAAARQLMSFADPTKVTEVVVIAVVSPRAAVPFANELSRSRGSSGDMSFREEAGNALDVVAAEFEGWGPKVVKKIRSGSPAAEIVRAAEQLEADLVVVASGGKGLSETILLGSTAQRIQHSAPCPVLVSRPTPRTPPVPRRRASTSA
ncbi:nucleotide-binding universal stress UspA family protein [Labedella gwakjiensis]|uniref:Nucleotide-binding universal stress UspA family protein n=2 Tax=Labedella gwakjiensis TaxID=390269 RepID=A0A2P8GYY9_9MICO|nr:nucleotide-binding universal stress UspA family protein [Labedella gwakjiensis]RUQ87870.1 universal stress protein [Labedella gwakjiensis]